MTLIQVIRRMQDLHLQYLLTAQELAIMAMRQSKSGIVTISYSYLARKIHAGCRKTAIRHIERLCAMRIIAKKPVTRLAEGWYAWNTYKFLVPFESNAPHTYYGDTMESSSKMFKDKQPSKFPEPGKREEDPLSLREKIRQTRNSMKFMDPDRAMYRDHQAEIERLQALLEGQTE